jgi:acyl-CoA thioesterase II
LVKKALQQNDIPPKYRDYLKLRIEESSPVDYREIAIPKPSFVAVSILDLIDLARIWMDINLELNI